MSVTVSILNGPLGPAGAPPAEATDAGAVVVFEGLVRAQEDGKLIRALEYEAYMPMASVQLMVLGEEILAKHGLLAMRIEHSQGSVPVGQCSFRLLVASSHRKQALAAMDEFIDRMKKDVPIWKRAVWK